MEQKENRPFKKAVVKGNGETVMVRMCSEPISVLQHVYETEDGLHIPEHALEFEKEIDWEQRRYEIAKDIIHAKIVRGEALYAADIIACANILIEELKKK